MCFRCRLRCSSCIGFPQDCGWRNSSKGGVALDWQPPVPETSPLWCHAHSQQMVTHSSTLLQKVLCVFTQKHAESRTALSRAQTPTKRQQSNIHSVETQNNEKNRFPTLLKNEILKMLDRPLSPDPCKTFIGSSSAYALSFQQIPWKSI